MNVEHLAKLLRELLKADENGEPGVSLCACETCTESTAKWLLPRLGDAPPEPSEAEIDAAVEAIAPKHFGLQTWPALGLTRSEIATMIRAVDRVRHFLLEAS